MKIVELGHTGVGKTTYMASMYGVFQSQIGGFSLSSMNLDDHTRLDKLANLIKSGQYPPPTAQRDEYKFYLQYQGKNALPFIWSDYRGAAIRERSDSEQANKPQRDLREADGLMIFCDCQALATGNTHANEIRRITVLVTNALKNLNHPISLAIVFTKADLVDKFHPNLLDGHIRGFIEVIEASDLVSGALIPVACGIKPINVQIPLLFALQAGVQLKVKSLKDLIDHHTS